MKRFLRIIPFFSSLPLLTFGQLVTAHCVHSEGIRFLLDAYLGSIGACNCQRSGVLLTGFPKCEERPYVLVFEDNFESDSLDRTKWQNVPHAQGSFKNAQRMDISVLRNVVVRDGMASILAKKETLTMRAVNWKRDDEILEDGFQNLREYHYTGCIVFSKQKFHYGKYEIRCRMPKGNGFWPAFWLFGGERYNEIDIFDSYGGIHELISSVGHDYQENGVVGCNDTQRGIDLSEWHTFGCEWQTDKIVFTVDSRQFRVIYRVVTPGGKVVNCGDDISSGLYYESKAFPIEPMNLIFNMVVISDKHGPGGSKPPDENTLFPGSFDVDYIRYWKKEPNTVIVFPNPTTGSFQVKSEVPMQRVRVSNALGNVLLLVEPGKVAADINISAAPDGVYIIAAEMEGFVIRSMVIKISP